MKSLKMKHGTITSFKMEDFMEHEIFMIEALNEAQKAYEKNEVPIGAVIVFKNEIIARGHNIRNTLKNPLCHAEIIAINNAAEFIGDWRLEECDLYVTIEPCPMCAGAIIQARIPRIIFGARNKKAGCAGSITNILNNPQFNHQTEIVEGILLDECSALMSSFFKQFRIQK